MRRKKFLERVSYFHFARQTPRLRGKAQSRASRTADAKPLPRRLKPMIKKRVIATLKRCATQKQVRIEFFRSL